MNVPVVTGTCVEVHSTAAAVSMTETTVDGDRNDLLELRIDKVMVELRTPTIAITAWGPTRNVARMRALGAITGSRCIL